MWSWQIPNWSQRTCVQKDTRAAQGCNLTGVRSGVDNTLFYILSTLVRTPLPAVLPLDTRCSLAVCLYSRTGSADDVWRSRDWVILHPCTYRSGSQEESRGDCPFLYTQCIICLAWNRLPSRRVYCSSCPRSVSYAFSI